MGTQQSRHGIARLRSDGFTVVEGVVLLVFIAALMVATWLFFARTKPVTIQDPGASDASTQDETANWPLYHSLVEGFHFKYPADWQVEVEDLDSGNPLVKEAVRIKGPNNFTLRYDLYQLENETAGCAGCSFQGVSELSQANFVRPLYMVVNSQTVSRQPYQTLSISEQRTLGGQLIKSWPYYRSEAHTGYAVRFTGQYALPGSSFAPIYSTYEEFNAKPEVVTAKKILGTLAY